MLGKAGLAEKEMLGLGKAGALGVSACLPSLADCPRATLCAWGDSVSLGWECLGQHLSQNSSSRETKVGADTLDGEPGLSCARAFVSNLGEASGFCLFSKNGGYATWVPQRPKSTGKMIPRGKTYSLKSQCCGVCMC